jgi:hypothetical protein
MAAGAVVMVVGDATRMSVAEVATTDAGATAAEVAATAAVAAVASASSLVAAAAAAAEDIGVGLTACGRGVLIRMAISPAQLSVLSQMHWL